MINVIEFVLMTAKSERGVAYVRVRQTQVPRKRNDVRFEWRVESVTRSKYSKKYVIKGPPAESRDV